MTVYWPNPLRVTEMLGIARATGSGAGLAVSRQRDEPPAGRRVTARW